MLLETARKIADDLRQALEPACEPNRCLVVGSVRRGNKFEVHDLELALLPKAGRPIPEFGHKEELIFLTHVDKRLHELATEGRIRYLSGKERLKNYRVCLGYYGLEDLNPFQVQFFVTLPPAQWGVQCVIRTGPSTDRDPFSKWCVTNKSARGGLPDGYKVRHLGVYREEQLDARGEPLPHESPLPMPEELDFLNFVGLGWIEPKNRHAPR